MKKLMMKLTGNDDFTKNDARQIRWAIGLGVVLIGLLVWGWVSLGV